MKRFLFIRRVQGHSMVPSLPPGTLVIATGWFKRLRPGQVIVLEREGREIIKRLDRFELDRIFVLGDHAETSTDSRQFGALPRAFASAKVIWPRTRKPAM